MNRFWIRSAPGRLAMALGALVCVQRAQSQTTWSTPTDGLWSDVGKWSDGLPSQKAANLTVTGADYTVTVDAPPANPFTDLTLRQSTGENTTTLNVGAAGFASDNGLIIIGRNATLNLNEDGVMHHNGPLAAGGTIVEVRDGGIWNVNGGEVAFTNLVPSTGSGISLLTIGSVGEGQLNISSGVFRFMAGVGSNVRPNFALGNDSRGILTMTGGRLEVGTDYTFLARGARSYAEITLTNDAQMIVRDIVIADGNASTGIVHIAGSALLQTGRRNRIGEGLNARAEITVAENGRLVMTSHDTYLGAYLATGSGGTGILNVAGGEVSLGSRELQMGVITKAASSTHGEVNLTDGRLDTGHIYGGRAGANDVTARAVLNVSGGVMRNQGSMFLGEVGTSAAAPTGHPDSTSHATFNLSGSGMVTNNAGDLRLGMHTGGTGEIFQSGGVLVQQSAAHKTLVGYRGGVGVYKMTSGSFSAQGEVFVGGETAEGFPDSSGLLDISGGAFATTHSMHVGQSGQGTVSIGGGTLSAGNLNLASGDATLGFEFSAGGIGGCTVSGTLTIDPDAKLVIDANGAAANVNYTLVSCNARSGSFDLANITVLGGDPAWVDQDTDQNLHFRIPAGTILMLR